MEKVDDIWPRLIRFHRIQRVYFAIRHHISHRRRISRHVWDSVTVASSVTHSFVLPVRSAACIRVIFINICNVTTDWTVARVRKDFPLACTSVSCFVRNRKSNFIGVVTTAVGVSVYSHGGTGQIPINLLDFAVSGSGLFNGHSQGAVLCRSWLMRRRLRARCTGPKNR